MKINTYPIIRSLASFVLPNKIIYRTGSGGTISSEYCYSVWLRHLHYLIENKLFNTVEDIKRVAEIGPGDSIGIGLSSIYTGVCEYYAFDVIKHASFPKNISINKELFAHFLNRRDIPNSNKQRNTFPTLLDYSFPKNILNFNNDFYIKRYHQIERVLNCLAPQDVNIEYVVPWTNSSGSNLRNIDLIFSQAVMEHVEDIEFAYTEMYKWLKPGGVISHQIDFKAHEMTKEWYGHWYIEDKMWNFLSHGRKYPMNRLPFSSHIKIIEKAGFEIKFVKTVQKENVLKNRTPKVPGINFTVEDLVTSGALIQAIKR
jgi:hypothetical protein